MINLSYIMTTRNKLEALQLTLPRLLSAVEPDEEVIVIDGASTDGTATYLQGLHEAGRLQRFVSEPDSGEAHALNKALLLSRGQLIKCITDDDVFHFPTIQAQKRFMLERGHEDIAALFSEGADTDWSRPDPFVVTSQRALYQRWRDQRTPVVLSCLGMVLRRSALPLTGLFHTGVVPVDHEFCLRLSAGPARLALCTGMSYVRVLNPRSNSVTQLQTVYEQVDRIRAFYLMEEPGLLSRLVSRTLSPLRPMAARARQALLLRRARRRSTLPEDWAMTLARCEAWLEEQGRQVQPEFLA